MRFMDLHCDTLTALQPQGQCLRENQLHLDLLRMKEAGQLAQCFAIFVHQKHCIEQGITPYEYYQVHKALFYAEMEANADLIAPAFCTADILENQKKGLMSGILTVEAGEPLEGKTERLEVLKKDGVRMITLTWNFENELGFSHAIGGHLKKKGQEVVDAMNRLGILVDVSHLSDEGFWDCIALSQGRYPVIASHSDARALCGHSRNLTDEMLKALGNTGGVVGVNYYAAFLTPGGKEAAMEQVRAHVLHLIDKAGVDHVALGSDYDGIGTGMEWKDVSGTPALLEYLHEKISWEDLEKIAYRNALCVFR